MNFREYRENVQHGSYHSPLDYYYFGEEIEEGYVTYHWHPEWEIIHVIKGTLPLVVNDQNINVEAGQFYFLPPGNLHGIQWTNCAFESIVWDNERLMKILPTSENAADIADVMKNKKLRIKPELSKNKRLQRICEELFCYLSNENKSKDAMANRYCVIGCIYQLLGTIMLEEYYEVLPQKEGYYYNLEDNLKAALKLIEMQYTEPLGLMDLAEAAGLNHKYFCKVFKAVTLFTPMEYLNRYRVDVARHILTTNASITMIEVAEQCGFSDVSYFIRVFKRLVGTTPKQFQQQWEKQKREK